MIRLFCAVKIEATEALYNLIDNFRHELQGERINWVDPSNLHVTLKFFGDTPESKEKEISEALQRAASRLDQLHIRLKGCGTFGNRAAPRVIWVGIEKGSGLEDLWNGVNKNIRPLGYEPDRRYFVPHLTIGRIKHINRNKALEDLLEKYSESVVGEFRTGSFYLFQSILRPEGPVYIKRGEFRLEKS